MFKPKSIKKTVNVLDPQSEEDQFPVPKVVKKINKSMGLSIAQLSKIKPIEGMEDKKHFLAIQNKQAGLININYTKQKQDKPDKLMEKYIQEKIQGVIPLAYNGTQDPTESENIRDEELIAEIRNQERRFLKKSVGDDTFYDGGIMEVNLSLEEKAQQLGQMEDLKGGQYLKTLIEGKPKKAQVVIIHPDEDEDKEDRQYKDIKDKFYQRGRIFKYQQQKKLESLNNEES